MKKNKFKPYIVINTEGKSIDIYLEDVASFREWIPGEGADICLLRALGAKPDPEKEARVVGASLPYYGSPKDLKIHIV